MSQAAPLPPTDEIRRLMHLDWAADAVPLEDADRAARLYGVVADPYYRRAFGALSRYDLALLCIYRMMENGRWEQAFRSISRLDRMERDAARARAAPPQPRPDPIIAAVPASPRPTARPPGGPAPTSTRELLAMCADRSGLTIAQLEAAAEADPPFT